MPVIEALCVYDEVLAQMIFDDEFIEWVDDHPIEGIAEACKRHELMIEEASTGQEWNEHEHEILWEVGSFVQLILNANDIDLGLELPQPAGSIQNNCVNVNEFIGEVLKTLEKQSIQLKAKGYRDRYNGKLKGVFAYEFSEGDLNRIQQLLNELREHITTSTGFEKKNISKGC